MADNELIQFIKRQLADSATELELRQALLQEGWHANEINEAMDAAKGAVEEKKIMMPVLSDKKIGSKSSHTHMQKEEQSEQKKEVSSVSPYKKYVSALAVIALLAFGGGVYFTFIDSQTSIEIVDENMHFAAEDEGVQEVVEDVSDPKNGLAIPVEGIVENDDEQEVEQEGIEETNEEVSEEERVDEENDAADADVVSEDSREEENSEELVEENDENDENGNTDVSVSIDSSEFDDEKYEVLTKGVFVSLFETPLQATYIAQTNQQRIIMVQGTADTGCTLQKLVIPGEDIYQCNGASYQIIIDEAKSNDDEVYVQVQESDDDSDDIEGDFEKDEPVEISEELSQEMTVCEDDDCFTPRFLACVPTQILLENHPFLGGDFQFTLQKNAEGECRGTLQTLTNQYEDWVGKTMECAYSERIAAPSIFAALAGDNCEGELNDIIKEQQIY